MDSFGRNNDIMVAKSIVCDVCKKVFKSKSYLNVHRRFHTGETPYKCEDCDKTFIYKSKLKRHMLVHSGKKEFQCYVCHKKFS